MLIDTPWGQPLPSPYPWLLKQRFKLPLPWRFLETLKESERLRQEYLRKLAETTPVKDLFPFAFTHPPADVAGFVVEKGLLVPQVITFNLPFAQHPEPSGWPGYRVYDDLWGWLRDQVLDDARQAELSY